ncbi:Tox-REase-5 domain-containing protein [Gordonia metallireducens]|uniref:Tox-REase-5 domain-containing protein n=1 Tax=Gordonia metallireducens TaxID=2897779 RepID=UPI001E5F6D53|nr:Tox-REase-5 domain-containing protein [Gordonia metallireducens]
MSQAQVLEASSKRTYTEGGSLGTSGGWTGPAYSTAFYTVEQFHETHIRTADVISEAGGTAHGGLTEMHHAAVTLLAQADAAEANRCLVSDNWIVTAVDPGAEDAEERVALWQGLINRAYYQLVDADDASSGKIQTVAFPLILGALAGASLLEIAALALIATAAVVGAALAINWAIENFPDIDINELLNRADIDTSGGGSGEWVPENESGWSKRAADYERQVTGTDPGVTYKIPSEDAPSGSVKVDGMEPATDDTKETWIEAKGEGYDWMIKEDGSLKKTTFAEQLPDQLQRQYDAAEEHDAEVEWRVATPALEKAVEKQIEDLGLGDRIRVKHVPPEK